MMHDDVDDFDDDDTDEAADSSDEGLDIPSEDDDPEGDYEFARTVTTPAIEVEAMARARASIPTRDAMVGTAMELTQMLINTLGDKDEVVRRIGEDIQQTLRVVFLEIRQAPGHVLTQVILAEEHPAKRARMIADARAALDDLEAHFQMTTS